MTDRNAFSQIVQYLAEHGIKAQNLKVSPLVGDVYNVDVTVYNIPFAVPHTTSTVHMQINLADYEANEDVLSYILKTVDGLMPDVE